MKTISTWHHSPTTPKTKFSKVLTVWLCQDDCIWRNLIWIFNFNHGWWVWKQLLNYIHIFLWSVEKFYRKQSINQHVLIFIFKHKRAGAEIIWDLFFSSWKHVNQLFIHTQSLHKKIGGNLMKFIRRKVHSYSFMSKSEKSIKEFSSLFPLFYVLIKKQRKTNTVQLKAFNEANAR